jgi:phage-related protein
MTLHEKLQSKLQPHTDRIKDGSNDEFDYFPAVLQHLIEEQKRQSKEIAEFVNAVGDDVKSGVTSIKNDVQNGVTSIRSDVQGDINSAKDEVRSAVTWVGDDVKSGVNLIKDDIKNSVTSIKSDVQTGINSVRDDIKSDADATTNSLTELKAAIAREFQKTQRLLLTGLIFGMATLGGVVTIAVLLYVRH